MKAITPLLSLGLALIGSLGGVSSAQAQSLDYQNYNAIIFNDFSTSSEVEGRVFVGNNYTGGNSSNIGIHLKPTIAPDDQTFVVGNNLLNGNPINLQRGSLYIGGTTNGRIVNYNGGGSLVADSGIGNKLDTIRDYSLAQSLYFQNLTPTSDATFPSSSGQPGPTKFTAVPGADGIAVFNVNAADIFQNPKAQQIELIANAMTTSTVVINVSGKSINWNQGNMIGAFNTDLWQGRTLWNFYEAETINFNGNNFHGAVLAPLASITTRANIDGLVVANNLTTSAEVHLPNSNDPLAYAYNGFTAPIPEPGGVIFLVAAAGLFLVARNRRLMV